MTKDEEKRFKALFKTYCWEECVKGNCEPDECEYCPVASAMEKIFFPY